VKGTNGEEPTHPLATTAPSALHTKRVASTNTLQAQEAPVDVARNAMSPELIASKMMDGLAKYAAMKQSGLTPNVSLLH
jgi:hypothetical protein